MVLGGMLCDRPLSGSSGLDFVECQNVTQAFMHTQ